MKKLFRISFPRITYTSFPRSARESVSSRSAARSPLHCLIPILRSAWQPSAWVLVLLLSFAAPVPAVVEYHPFDDPVKEEVYQSLISELRCLVCQNQTIADSNADLAKDLRQQVYDMLQQGKSREDVVDFMTQRYGDFVMYRPAFNVKTGLLWLGPIAFLLIGIITVVTLAKNKKAAEKPVLNQQQRRELDRLLQKGEED